MPEQTYKIGGRKLICPWCDGDIWEFECCEHEWCPHCGKYIGDIEGGTPITIVVTMEPTTGMPWANVKEV